MDGREVRSHISNVVDLLSEILAEIKGLRMELVEQRAVTCDKVATADLGAMRWNIPYEQYYGNEKGTAE